MSSTLKLLRIAIGDPAFTDAVLEHPEPADLFHLYRVSLPTDRFRGLPPEWLFAVLDSDAFEKVGRSRQAVVDAAQRLVETRGEDLLFLISAEPIVRLNDDIGPLGKRIFCLDAPNVPRNQPPTAADGRLTPFVNALQRRGLANQPLGDFSPYQRNKPVNGWRFFGRKRELRKLVDHHENFVIVGARRMGKTSLMQEAKRILEQRGEIVHYAFVQDYNAELAAKEILKLLSQRAHTRAIRHGQALRERPLEIALHEMTAGRRKVTLLIDELGSVISSLDPEAKEFLIRLRKHSHDGKLRVIISCFEEVFVRQQHEFTGPLVNFGSTLRIEPFSDADVEELVFAPLEIWKPLQPADRQKLKKTISATIGHHPLFIQYFCEELFKRLMNESDSLIQAANSLIRGDMAECFGDPIKQVFWGLSSSLLKYLFLLRCQEANSKKEEIWQATLDDDWLIKTLKHLGFCAVTDARRAIIEGLEVHGLCAAADYNRTRQRITVPIVYRYLKEVESPVSDLIEKLAQDIDKEQITWRLERI